MQRMVARLLEAVVILFSFVTLTANAGNDYWYWFGDKDVDYFSEGRKIKDPLKPEIKKQKKFNIEKGRAPIREYDAFPFEWADYDDPSSPVFFDEGGDYVPPRPLQMLAANPTKENAAHVKRWQQRKLQVSMMLAKLLSDEDETERALASVKWRDFGLYYFYGSSCSVCKTQAPVIKELESLGVQVTPIQVDYQSAPASYPRSLNYDDNMKRAFEINVTPSFALFGKNRSSQWEGFTSLKDLKSKILTLMTSRSAL